MATPLLIGISARIHHPEGAARDLGGVYTKTLHYLEQSVAHWVISANVLVFMIPAMTAAMLLAARDRPRGSGFAVAIATLAKQTAPPAHPALLYAGFIGN